MRQRTILGGTSLAAAVAAIGGIIAYPVSPTASSYPAPGTAESPYRRRGHKYRDTKRYTPEAKKRAARKAQRRARRITRMHAR